MALARVTFDRGDLQVAGVPRKPNGPLAAIPGVVWDDLVPGYRAPAAAWLAIAVALREAGIRWIEQTPPTTGWLSEFRAQSCQDFAGVPGRARKQAL